MELKDTLLMPKTDFEMRGNLPKKEPAFQKLWKDIDLYNKLLTKNSEKTPFILHDGPPYANGSIHAGHALNKILKDIFVRIKAMEGYYTPFIPGWDTHGLPIETALTKKGVNRKELSVAEFRKMCEEYAINQIDTQAEQMKKLGILDNFDNKYITLQKEFEAEQVRVFASMIKQGIIYKGLKPVYWSPTSESALAEAEIEYHDKQSNSIYVSFKVSKKNSHLKGDESFIIWTTTPWTLPANLAICLNPELEYGIYETDRGIFILLASLIDTLSSKLNFKEVKLRELLLGKQLELVEAKHPLYDRISIVICGDHVTDTAGTGCVHTAPGHGEDDFKVGKKYSLDVLCPVNGSGVLTAEAGEFAGLFYEKANEAIIKKLTDVQALLFVEKITHSYPHDWRTKKPIIFRATNQWFASIDKIRNKLLSEIASVNWYPNWGQTRLHNMISDRGDWCISRQRVWGVPIPVFYSEDGQPILDLDVMEHVAQMFEQHGSNIWFTKEATDLLPSGYKHVNSPNGIFYKETDIMDVWFDSGSSNTAVLKKRNIGYPADLYLEGSDQYRGWFNSSLIIGTIINGTAPYSNVVSHGFILDAKGEKMSKSSNNGVDPNSVVATYGADVLRLWAASIDYQADVRIGDDILKQIAESYRKIRNTFKFLLGNLILKNNKQFNKKMITNDLTFIDNLILNKLNFVVSEVNVCYSKYDLQAATQTIINFIVNDVSGFYADMTKDILYCDSETSLRRLQVQTVIYKIIDKLVRLLAPILVHTAEEVYACFDHEVESVHLLDSAKSNFSVELDDTYRSLMALRKDVLKALEVSRSEKIIGSSQDATVHIEILNSNLKQVFAKLSAEEKKTFFIVSEVIETKLNDDYKLEVSKVRVVVNENPKCIRCWNHYEEAVKSTEKLCHRCKTVLIDEK